MLYGIIRKLRLDSISRAKINDGSFYFLKLFYSDITGFKFIKNGSWTILNGSYDKFGNGYLLGRYGRNPKRNEVPLFYITKDDIKVFHKFNGIRHIHKVSVQFNEIFVTSGDLDIESHIYILNYNSELKHTIKLGQLSRTTDVHFDKDNIRWIMDSEYVDSWCILYNRYTNILIKIANIRQPTWHSIKIGNFIVFSTSYEKRSSWKGNYCIVYLWNILTNDIFPIEIFKKNIFQSLYFFPAQSISLENFESKVKIRFKGSISYNKFIYINDNLFFNFKNIDIHYLETNNLKKVLKKYQITKKQLILEVLYNAIKDERWFNYYLKKF